jgi:multiple sugar transport system permease protein
LPNRFTLENAKNANVQLPITNSQEKIMFKRLSYARMQSSKTVGLLLISPWLIGFLLFKFIPILASLGLSFTDFYMLEPGETQFIGLDNYRRIAENLPLGFLIVATLSVVIRTVPLQLGASLLFAAMLNNGRLKLSTFSRTLFSCPASFPALPSPSCGLAL